MITTKIYSYHPSPDKVTFQDLFSWQLSSMCYNIIDYRHHAVHYIPMTYLFYNWKLVCFDPLCQFHPLPIPLPLWQTPFCSLYLWFLFCFVCSFVVFLDSTYKWNLFFSVWLISLSLIPSRSMLLQMARFHFTGWVIFHCLYTTSSLFIHPSMDILCLVFK